MSVGFKKVTRGHNKTCNALLNTASSRKKNHFGFLCPIIQYVFRLNNEYIMYQHNGDTCVTPNFHMRSSLARLFSMRRNDSSKMGLRR
jgi:hypothetical protein